MQVKRILKRIGLAILVALGLWQLERKAWKEALISTLEQRLAATAVLISAAIVLLLLAAIGMRRISLPFASSIWKATTSPVTLTGA